jgi:nitrous oxide reductase accessory protein NosL
MEKVQFRVAAMICALMMGVVGSLSAVDPGLPTDKDRCGVCGMYVTKHPNWVAGVVFSDGSRVFFDGPKDLFRYILNPGEYTTKNLELSEVFVTDYYSTALVDAREAFFVSGSDVMGPMGPELVPIAKESHAKTFVIDHGGQAIFRFDEITREEIPR